MEQGYADALERLAAYLGVVYTRPADEVTKFAELGDAVYNAVLSSDLMGAGHFLPLFRVYRSDAGLAVTMVGYSADSELLDLLISRA